MPTGSERIHNERLRQMLDEGWGASHDDAYESGELISAAMCYMVAGRQAQRRSVVDDRGAYDGGIHWPWHPNWWKPSDDPIRNLEKAGALIAAEIDRLQRVRQLDRRIEDLHGPGSVAAIEAAYADGSLFGETDG